MDSMEKILEIVSKDCFMPSTDFKDAYFVVSIASDLRNFSDFSAKKSYTNSVVYLLVYHLLS